MENNKLIGYFIQKMKGHVKHVLYAYVINRVLTKTSVGGPDKGVKIAVGL
jgi:hypothetical protein